MTIPGTDPAIDKHNACVFDAIVPILGGQVGAGATVTYRSSNPYAHKLVGKMRKSIVAWLFHCWLQVCGYKLTMVQTLMESFNTEAALIAQFLTFNANALEVRTTFADENDYLESMEADLGINQGWATDDKNFDKSPKISLEGTHEALQQTLQDHPDDLKNAHRDGLSCRSDFTHSTGNSTLNNNRTARGPARREEVLKSLSLINKNCKLTEEYAKERDRFATKAGGYWLLEDCLQQFELRNAQSPTLLTNNAKMAVEGTRAAGAVPCSCVANKDEMVLGLQGGSQDDLFSENNTTSNALRTLYGLLQGSGIFPQQFMQEFGNLSGPDEYVEDEGPFVQGV
jgi:hypothetical protein